MLILIGVGLETKDISVRGLEAATEADRVYIEQYTAFIPKEYFDYLKETTGQEIEELSRSDLEENAKKTISGAGKADIAILVPGDPLIATTHHATLIDTARKMGIKCKILHSASIYSAAVGESGLDVYRFGPPVTVPFWSDKYKPTSFLESVKRNLENDQHTLLLLDLDQKGRKPMKLQEALSLLRLAEKEKEYDIINDNLMILVMGNVGRNDEQIRYTRLKEVEKSVSMFDNKLLVLVIPAKLSFAEEESVSRHLS